MRAARRWVSRCLGLVRKDRADREFADEIETLVAMHADEHRRAGLPAAEAERRARLAVGSVPALVEARRDGRSFPRVESLAQDLRQALRRLRQQPSFAVVCIAMHRYFETMGIPVLRGRGFTSGDREDAPPVVAINQTLARLLFGKTDPIGQRVRLGPASPVRAATVVGIVGDLRHTRLETPPAPEVYVNYEQGAPVAPLIVVRAAVDAAALAPTLRGAIRDVDPQLLPFNLRTMSDLRSAAVRDRQFLMSLISTFGVLALTLAALGVYGVMSLVVAEGRREMGVRLALGARPRRLMAAVVGRAMTSAGIGAAVGLAAALTLTPAMASQLYGVAPTDPLTVGSVLATLMAVALAASWIPARAVLRVDPITTLRTD